MCQEVTFFLLLSKAFSFFFLSKAFSFELANVESLMQNQNKIFYMVELA